MTNLSSTIKTIQNIMRKDSGVDGDAQRIGQLSWMLFLKIFSDSEENWSFYEEGYESPIPAELQWSAWASDDEGITGDELLDFVNNRLFPTLKNLCYQRTRRFKKTPPCFLKRRWSLKKRRSSFSSYI